jgi:ketosteroid isomerase-like protein
MPRIMRTGPAFLCLFLAATAVAARAGEMPSHVASLVAAERAFAKMSVAVSMRDAFLANLADGAILFNPGPTDGRAIHQDRAPSAVVLSWEPSYAEVAASGDFGFTTGPWEFRPDKDSEPTGFGHFVSVWKKQADGSWKVALDVGINHERLAAKPGELSLRASSDPEPWPLDAKGVAAARAALLDTDRAFAIALARGAAGAYRAHGADDVRYYRAGAVPVIGREAVGRVVGESGGEAIAEATAADVAASGDLGYTIGQKGAPVTAWYVRIWRLDAGRMWTLVLDIDSAVPVAGE